MLNWIWLALILSSILYAAFTGRMDALTRETLASGKDAVTLLIGLLGPMVLFLGLMNVARAGGLLHAVARALQPLMRRLFPDVPADHPAMGAMIMNIASNLFGMGNAATPFGLKAMVELEKLNARPGVASNSMVLFLAINTSSVTLLPTGTIAVREAANSANPAAIFPTTLIATICSTLAAVGAYYLLRRLPRFRLDPTPRTEAPRESSPESEGDPVELPAAPPPRARERLWIAAFWVGLAVALGLYVSDQWGEQGALGLFRSVTSYWLLPALIAFLLLWGVRGRVRVYEEAVEGGREGFEVAVRILPYFVLILVAVGMFRSSGALGALIGLLQPITDPVGVPGEALPMALLRPLSGTGAFGVMSEILNTHGPDSFVGQVTSTLQGSTETTFYVLALYLGAARVRDGRHSLAACLVGDLAGFVAAVAACHLFFG